MFLISPNIYGRVIMNRCCRIPVRFSNKFFHAEISTYKHFKKSFSLLSSSLPISGVLNTLYVYERSDTNLTVQAKRYYSKKKSSKRDAKEEEESDSDEEYDVYEELDDFVGLPDNVVKRNVPSLRLDTVIKSFVGITKKKVEKYFYANKIRVNGEPVVKKSLIVSIGDEIDVIKGFSPENNKFLLVDRIILKGIGKVNQTGTFPLTMEVFKSLTTENYEKPWSPSNMDDASDD